MFDDVHLESIFAFDWLTRGGLPTIGSQDTAPTGLPDSRKLQRTLTGTPQPMPTLAETLQQQQPMLTGTPKLQPTPTETQQQ